MLETSGRLLRLLALLQSRPEWSGADLADRLRVTGRTVRRDVERLRLLGYPVEARPGTGGGYRLGPGAVLPPLLLDDDEAVAVAVGLGSVAQSGLSGIEETALRALAKLEQVLPSRLRRQVRTVRSAVVPVAGAGPAADVEVLMTVAAAIRDQQRLRVDYRRHDGTGSRRVVEPHRVVHAGRRWYLVAWDVERADWRTLRLDRLTPHSPAGPRSIPREAPEPDLARYTARGITTDAYRHRCRLTVHAPAATVADRISPAVGVVTAIDDTSSELLLGSNDLDEAALWVGLLGAELTVHEPDELRAHLAALGARLVRAAARTAPPGGGQQPSSRLAR